MLSLTAHTRIHVFCSMFPKFYTKPIAVNECQGSEASLTPALPVTSCVAPASVSSPTHLECQCDLFQGVVRIKCEGKALGAGPDKLLESSQYQLSSC